MFIGRMPSSAKPRSTSMLTMRSFSPTGCGVTAIRGWYACSRDDCVRGALAMASLLAFVLGLRAVRCGAQRMDLLKDVGCGFEVVGELADLTYAEASNELTSLGHEILPARQPYFSVHFALVDDSLEAFHANQKIQTQW